MQTISSKLDSFRPHALDAVRVYLGLGLIVRGGLFIGRPDLLLELVRTSGDWFWPMAIAHFVVLAHITGGLMLAAGLFTRFAALVQLPAVLGAVFFVHAHEGLFSSGQSLELSVLVVFLLGLFAIVGAGQWSADAYPGSHWSGGFQPRAFRRGWLCRLEP